MFGGNKSRPSSGISKNALDYLSSLESTAKTMRDESRAKQEQKKSLYEKRGNKLDFESLNEKIVFDIDDELLSPPLSSTSILPISNPFRQVGQKSLVEIRELRNSIDKSMQAPVISPVKKTPPTSSVQNKRTTTQAMPTRSVFKKREDSDLESMTSEKPKYHLSGESSDASEIDFNSAKSVSELDIKSPKSTSSSSSSPSSTSKSSSKSKTTTTSSSSKTTSSSSKASRRSKAIKSAKSSAQSFLSSLRSSYSTTSDSETSRSSNSHSSLNLSIKKSSSFNSSVSKTLTPTPKEQKPEKEAKKSVSPKEMVYNFIRPRSLTRQHRTENNNRRSSSENDFRLLEIKMEKMEREIEDLKKIHSSTELRHQPPPQFEQTKYLTDQLLKHHLRLMNDYNEMEWKTRTEWNSILTQTAPRTDRVTSQKLKEVIAKRLKQQK